MVWPHVEVFNEGRGRYHQVDDNYAGAGKEKKGRPKKRWLHNIREDMTVYNMTEEMAENRSVWHVKIKASPLLHR